MPTFKFTDHAVSSTAGVAVEVQGRLRIDPMLRPENPRIKSFAGCRCSAWIKSGPKTLPSHYFYDDRGSELFEQICALAEYYPTRTETTILQTCA